MTISTQVPANAAPTLKFFMRPSGEAITIPLNNLAQPLQDWFKQNQIILSAEELTSREFVIYGRWPNQSEEDEQIYILNPLKVSANEAYAHLKTLLDKSKP